VEPGQSDELSRFGGLPWLRPGESWPRCGRCASPMTFFLQLDLARLPAELEGRFGSGLLQLFYCTADECEGGWEAFDEGQLVRVLHAPSGVRAVETPPEVVPFPARTIIGWDARVDHPHPPEHEKLGLKYTWDFSAKTVRVECDAVGLSAELPFSEGGDDLPETIATAEAGDKLAGWPCWVQDMDYPACPSCGQRMEIVFQLDSEDNVPYMFGDVGTGHITQCPQHLDVFAFAWACH
jgi:uncharacterized protein YwqG